MVDAEAPYFPLSVFLIFNNPYADVREFQRDVVHQKALNYNCSDCYPKIGGKLEVGGAAVYYWDAAQISASNKLHFPLQKLCTIKNLEFNQSLAFWIKLINVPLKSRCMLTTDCAHSILMTSYYTLSLNTGDAVVTRSSLLQSIPHLRAETDLAGRHSSILAIERC